MPVYMVPVTFKFEGHFEIQADSPEEAQECAEMHCGMTTSGIHSSLPDADWNFPVHPEKEVGKISGTQS